jgi:hypothetical protein
VLFNSQKYLNTISSKMSLILDASRLNVCNFLKFLMQSSIHTEYGPAEVWIPTVEHLQTVPSLLSKPVLLVVV